VRYDHLMRAWRWLVAGGVLAAAILVLLLVRCRAAHRSTTSTGVGSSAIAGSGSAHATGRIAKPLPKLPVGGLRLEGQVIDEADRPVAGATVRFYNFEGSTTTAEDGSFVFENLGPNEYQVVAEASEDTWCDMVAVELAATSEPVILRVFAGATATVHVVDADGGKPIAGARMSDYTSDANGDVKLRGLRPGNNHLLILGVEADGYERARAKITDLDLGTPSANVFVVELRRGVVVSGTVVGPNGEKVTTGEVTASVDKRTRSDADIDETGAWKLTLAAGTFELTASSEGRESPIQIFEVDGKAARGGIVLRLPAAKPVPTLRAVLEGVVVDEKGAPVAGAEVAISAGAVDQTEKTDARGKFRATLAAGAASVTASARKGDVASAETTLDIQGERVELRIVVGPATIAGTVVDGRGRPAPGVRVSLRVPSDAITTLSDDKGRWELRGLVPGEHPIVVAPNDLEYSRATPLVMASTGDRDVRLVVTYAGAVRGRVVLDGKPVAYYGAFIEDPILDRPVLVRAADGRFAIRGIAAGTWRIIVAGPA
jgi:Carboxypeptidase regulatory-like domain